MNKKVDERKLYKIRNKCFVCEKSRRKRKGETER